MRSLELCESPARILNVTGPETVQVRRAAEFFARRFRRELLVKGESRGEHSLSKRRSFATLHWAILRFRPTN